MILFLGYPNWWNTMPMPVIGFLEHYNWRGKRIILFVTSGGSGFGKSIEDLKQLCPGVEIAEGGAFLGYQVEISGAQIAAWAKQALQQLEVGDRD